MSETSKTLRAIAHNYIKAAEHMEAAEWLAASVESCRSATEQPWRERIADAHDLDPCELADVEPMETIGNMVVEPPSEDRLTSIADMHARCIVALGWDPDTISTAEACTRIASLCDDDLLDCTEVLEKRRSEMSPCRAVRASVLAAIDARRAELEAAGVQS